MIYFDLIEGDLYYTLWDRWEVKDVGGMTLDEFCNHFKVPLRPCLTLRFAGEVWPCCKRCVPRCHDGLHANAPWPQEPATQTVMFAVASYS